MAFWGPGRSAATRPGRPARGGGRGGSPPLRCLQSPGVVRAEGPGGPQAGRWELSERRGTHLQQHRQQEAQVHLVDAHLPYRLERLLHLHGGPRSAPGPAASRSPPLPALPGGPCARAPRRAPHSARLRPGPGPGRGRGRKRGRGGASARAAGAGGPAARALRASPGLDTVSLASGLPVREGFLGGAAPLQMRGAGKWAWAEASCPLQKRGTAAGPNPRSLLRGVGVRSLLGTWWRRSVICPVVKISLMREVGMAGRDP